MRCLKEKFNLLPVIVDLQNLENSKMEFDFALAPEEVDLSGESAKLKAPVKVKGELRRGIAQTDVSGTIIADVVLECTRCLTETAQRLDIPLAAAFVAPENYTQAREAEIGVQDLGVSILEDDQIDLTELVREQILLNLPAQIFCREDCQGLCEKCGVNRNLINCNCEEKEIDPRWQGLRELKIRNEK